MVFDQNAQKDIFGAQYEMRMPSQEDITSYFPETPVTFEIDMIAIPQPAMPEMPPMP
jgi:hypothetical protein